MKIISFTLPVSFALLLAAPQKSFAWGWEGHSVTALVAQQILTDQSNKDQNAAKALATVKAILGDTTFDEAATWADKVKSQARECKETPYLKDPAYGTGPKKGQTSAVCEAYAYTSSWHIINTDLSAYAYDPSDKDYFKGDMVVMLNGLAHVLKGEPAKVLTGVRSYDNWKQACLKKPDHTAQSCKKEALQFLMHIIGDLHQPLHAGAECDLGANMQEINFFGSQDDPSAGWCTGRKPDPSDANFPKKDAEYKTCRHHELHQAWDKNILVNAPQSHFKTPGTYASQLVKAMAGAKQSADDRKCVRTAADAQTKIDEPNGPLDWVNESICYQTQVYSFPDDSTQAKASAANRTVAQAAENPVTNRCRADRTVKALDENGQPLQVRGHDKISYFTPFEVGAKYYATNSKTVDERLYWSGYRLANLLKDIYGAGDKAPNFDK